MREPAAKRAAPARTRGARPAQGTRKAPTARKAAAHQINAASKAPTPQAAPQAIGARRSERLQQPAQPAGAPPAPPRAAEPERTTGRDILGIAAQAAGELAEIGLSVSARALRNAVSRLPRP
jgi:hypothetical protein